MRGSCISRPQLIRSQRGSRDTAFASTGRLRAVDTRTSGNGGRPYGKTAEKDNTPAPKDGPAPAGSGAIEERGAEFTCCAKFSRIVPPRDGRIHRLVLLRTSILVQPNRLSAISALPDTEKRCGLDDQCAAGRGVGGCLRGVGHRPPKLRGRGRYP